MSGGPVGTIVESPNGLISWRIGGVISQGLTMSDILYAAARTLPRLAKEVVQAATSLEVLHTLMLCRRRAGTTTPSAHTATLATGRRRREAIGPPRWPIGSATLRLPPSVAEALRSNYKHLGPPMRGRSRFVVLLPRCGRCAKGAAAGAKAVERWGSFPAAADDAGLTLAECRDWDYATAS